LEVIRQQLEQSIRDDIFDDYNLGGCTTAFGKFLEIQEQSLIVENQRTLFILRKWEQTG